MSAPLVAVLVVVLVLLVLFMTRVLVGTRRARRHSGFVATWTRHPATRPTRTVRLLRDPDEVASAVDRAASRERDAARRLSERADRISRLVHRERDSPDEP